MINYMDSPSLSNLSEPLRIRPLQCCHAIALFPSLQNAGPVQASSLGACLDCSSPVNSLFQPALHTPPLKHSFQHGTPTQVLMMPSYLEQLNLNNRKPPSTDPRHLFLKAEFLFGQISCALNTRLSDSLFTKSTLQAHSPVHAFAHTLKPFSSSRRSQALALLSAAQRAPSPLVSLKWKEHGFHGHEDLNLILVSRHQPLFH